jgi:hypothetical protein
MDLHRRRWLWCVGRYLRGRAAARSKRSARATSSTPPPTSGTGTAPPPGHFMTPLLHHRSRPRRPAPGSRLGRACHRRRIQPALIRNVTVSGPAADGDTDRAQSEGVLVRPPSYDPQRHITTGPASFSASFMRPVQPTIAAGRRAVITGPSWRWQRGEPGFRSPYGRNGRYSGKLFRWLPVGLPALSFNIGTSL